MTPRTLPTAFCIAAIGLLGQTALAQSTTAIITRTDGSVLRGVTVTSMTYEQVEFTNAGSDERLLSVEIAGIEWAGMSAEYAKAQAFQQQGNHAEAANLFAEAANKTSDEQAKTDTRFIAARALVEAARTKAEVAADAATAMNGFVDANPDHFRIPAALLSLGVAQRIAGDGATAIQTLKRLEDETVGRGYGQVWSARARFEKALAHLEMGAGRDARTAFQSAASAAESGMSSAGANRSELERLKLNAKVGEGESWIAEGNFSQARDFFQKMARNAAAGVRGAALRAAALAGEGESLYRGAESSGNTADLRKAQLALAEADVIDTTGGDTSAKAGYYLGMVTIALGAEGGGDSFKSRARAYLQSVVKQHPSSRWAAKARTALDN